MNSRKYLPFSLARVPIGGTQKIYNKSLKINILCNTISGTVEQFFEGHALSTYCGDHPCAGAMKNF
jgi:hypothetical protein